MTSALFPTRRIISFAALTLSQLAFITTTQTAPTMISAFTATAPRLAARRAPSSSAAAASTVRAMSSSATAAAAADTDATTNTLDKLWNDQVHKELLASQVYLSAAIWCKNQELEGMGKYMLQESEEERGHALAFVDFAQKKQIPLKLRQVDGPPTDWDSVADLWQNLLKLEEENTQSLFRLHEKASHDPSLVTFLQPFHTEQVESEDALRTKVAQIQDESKTPGLIRQLDQQLGAQVDEEE